MIRSQFYEVNMLVFWILSTVFSVVFAGLYVRFNFRVLASPAKNPIYELTIGKNLNSLESEPEEKVVVRLEGKLNFTEDVYELLVQFDYVVEKVKEVTSLTLYLATERQEISEIVFKNGEMSQKFWAKPWNLVSEDSEINDSVQSTKVNVSVPQKWIPTSSVINKISASIEGIGIDGKPFVFNYYGLKNYLISFPDRYVVQNYMTVDLDVFADFS